MWPGAYTGISALLCKEGALREGSGRAQGHTEYATPLEVLGLSALNAGVRVWGVQALIHSQQ